MHCIKTNRHHSKQSGYVLLAVLLAMTLMLIVLTIEAPRIAQQIKREREEELVHRGKDYATAIKRFVHKNGGQYPLSVEQLENTNHVRFLRKKYKDPMTGESDWKMVHAGEAEIKIPTPNPGLNNGNPTGQSSTLSSTPVAPSNNQTSGGGTNSAVGTPNTNTSGTLTTSNIGNGQTVGGGQIIGVASVNKKQSIKEFNEKDHYDEWYFVYDLRLEQSGGSGVTVAAPRGATAATGGTTGTSGVQGAPGSTASQNPPNPTDSGQPTPPGQPTPAGQPTPTGTPTTPPQVPN